MKEELKKLKNGICIFSELEDKSIFKSGLHTYMKINEIATHTKQIYNSVNLDTGYLEYIYKNLAVTKINGKFIEE